MAVLTANRIGLVFLGFLGLVAWRHPARPVAMPPPAHPVAVPAPDTPHDTAAVLDQLEHLGNIAYDHPEQVVGNPEAFLSRLSALPVTAEGREMYAWLLLNIGYALREHGNILKSAYYYEQAMDYCSEHHLTEPDAVLYIAKPLGNLYTQIGDLQRALHLQRQAIALTTQRGELQLLPAMYTNIAIVYQQIGWTDSVLHACRKGLAILHPQRGASQALLHNIMAGTYMALGEQDSARRYSRMAVDGFAGRRLSGDTLVWYASSLLQRGLVEGTDHPQRAVPYVDRAIALVEHHFPRQKRRELAKYYQARGKLLGQQGKYGGAKHDYARVLALLNTGEGAHFPDYTYTEALWGLAQVHAASQGDSAAYYYRLAVENAFYTQQLITSAESQYQNSQWNREVLTEAMDCFWQLYQRHSSLQEKDRLARTMFWIAELSKGRQLLLEVSRTMQWSPDTAADELANQRRTLQYLYQRVSEENDPAARQALQAEAQALAFDFQRGENHFGQSFEPPHMERFMGELAVGDSPTTLLSYVLVPDNRGYVLTWAEGHFRAHQLADTLLTALPTFVARYFGDSPEAYTNNPAQYRKWATVLANGLFPPGVPLGENLALSPDGILHRLPFDALQRNNRFLALDHATRYTYTFLLQYPHATEGQSAAGIHVFAKEAYAGTGLPDLPFVATEAAYLQERFEALVHRDAAATDSAFLLALAGSDVVHLAAHAVSDGITPPYVMLTQRVTLDNLRYLRAGAPLVFLAACQTATGRLLQGEGTESLNRAFLSKGIRGVIASYWPVDDQTTATITRHFYDALASSGSPALALWEAKRTYLASASGGAENPWYWAALQFTGAEERIRLQPQHGTRYWLLGGIAVAGLLALGIYLNTAKR